MAQSVILFAQDPSVAHSLLGGLRSHFQAVLVTNSHHDLRETVTKNRPEAVVLEIEASRLSDVTDLRRQFPLLPIVCTHRIPDEDLWMAALDAGASDVCPADDVKDVLTSVLRNVALVKAA
jgi:DNA-binding NarL/FixJ family response regulator